MTLLEIQNAVKSKLHHRKRFTATTLANECWPEHIKMNKSGALYNAYSAQVTMVLKNIKYIRRERNTGIYEVTELYTG